MSTDPGIFALRLATPVDVPRLQELIPLSARGLSQSCYSTEQIESLIRHVFGPDSQLIADATYYVAEGEGQIVGCGGWSRRSTLYGGDQMKAAIDPLLDPAHDAARIRAFFVHPHWSRRGVGAGILQACMEAAATAGFRKVELMATLPGIPLYRRFGFEELDAVHTTLPDGVSVSFVRMARGLTRVEG